jgi:integrase
MPSDVYSSAFEVLCPCPCPRPACYPNRASAECAGISGDADRKQAHRRAETRGIERPSLSPKNRCSTWCASQGKSAGLQGVHPHTLRHSCGYYLANRGTDLRTMQDYLGHRDPRHTVHYTRVAGRRFEG